MLLCFLSLSWFRCSSPIIFCVIFKNKYVWYMDVIMCVCICVHISMYVCALVCRNVWKPDVNISWLPISFSTPPILYSSPLSPLPVWGCSSTTHPLLPHHSSIPLCWSIKPPKIDCNYVPETYHFLHTGWPMNFRDLAVSHVPYPLSPALGLQTSTYVCLFPWLLGIEIQVLTIVQ